METISALAAWRAATDPAKSSGTGQTEIQAEGTTRSEAAMSGGRECLWSWRRMMKRTVVKWMPDPAETEGHIIGDYGN